MHAVTQPTPTLTTDYFVGIVMLGVRHYFPVGSRAAATALAKTAASVHKIRSVKDGEPVEYGRVWIEGARTASERELYHSDDWQRRWEHETDVSVRELAKLCCGLNPDSDVLPDPGACHAAQERILRAVRAGKLHPIDVAVPFTRAEFIFRDGPLLPLREAAVWATKYFPAFPLAQATEPPTFSLLDTPTDAGRSTSEAVLEPQALLSTRDRRVLRDRRYARIDTIQAQRGFNSRAQVYVDLGMSKDTLEAIVRDEANKFSSQKREQLLAFVGWSEQQWNSLT